MRFEIDWIFIISELPRLADLALRARRPRERDVRRITF